MVIIVSVLVLLLITVVVISVVIYYRKKNKKKNKDSLQAKNNAKPQKKNCQQNYISPKKFSVGWVYNSPQNSASACYSNDNAIRYPINPPYVNYGPSPVSDDCECTEFIKPP